MRLLSTLRRRYGRAQATRDYEWVVYPQARVEGEGVKVRPSSLTHGLPEAKRIAKEHRGSGIYSVTKGRFIGWINYNGNFVQFR